MKRYLNCLALAACAWLAAACGGRYSYESVPGDPMNARIYTLDNGLKVYMTVNKDEPRIQTYIAVRVGGKNDPAETTGLAHYFEHLMFKGTENVGTANYELEKPLLDEIEQKFEYYRTVQDPALREKIYAEIDSLSYAASGYAIPNEYDKLMAAIGAKGTNAYTGTDMTVYVEDIPSNQVENWAKIQSDRFRHNVIRGFHTELETVYEEKNMSLTNDMEKVQEALYGALYPHHPYGTQTVLGTQEHLKNPSITNIKRYYRQWYVPNNMAICLSGDFNPEEMIAVIDKYFGDMEPNPELPVLAFEAEKPLTEPVEKTVYGLESPYVMMGWSFPGASSPQADTLALLAKILYNGKAGLIDRSIIRPQRMLEAYCSLYDDADYSTFVLSGEPMTGQSLEEVKDLLLEQLEAVKAGRFSDSLLTAVLNNDKLNRMRRMERNSGRANQFVNAFIDGIPWKQVVEAPQRLSRIGKADVVAFANRHFGNNYVAVYKKEGRDDSVLKISKPRITPIQTNRNAASPFLEEIRASVPEPVAPVFLDFERDLDRIALENGQQMLYKKNTDNGLFSLSYVFDMGAVEDRLMPVATAYLSYLGTGTMSADEINDEFYRMGCSYNIAVASDKITVSLSGLQENMARAAELLENLLGDARPDAAVLENLKRDLLLARINAKQNQSQNYARLVQYVMYGPKNPVTSTTLSEKEIRQLDPAVLTARLRELPEYEHTVLYYGPEDKENVQAMLRQVRRLPQTFKPVPENPMKMQTVQENAVYLAPYDAKQIYMLSYSNNGQLPDPAKTPYIRVYNDYFGSGANSLVFQEMREARGLAYRATAQYVTPARADEPYSYTSFIATQNDKMMDAVLAFDEIINNMPQSETAFAVVREKLLSTLRTERIRGAQVLSYYLSAREMGLDYDIRKEVFESVEAMTLADLVKFQQENVKGRLYRTAILGDEKDLDLKSLSAVRGKIIRLTTEDIFGY